MLPVQDMSAGIEAPGQRIWRWAIAVAIVAALLSLLAPDAKADTMSIKYRGTTSVSYYIDGVKRTGGAAEFYSSTAFQSQMWFGYCVDPAEHFTSPLEMASPGAWDGPDNIYPAVTGYDWHEAAWLIENFAPGVDWLAGSPVDYGSAAVRSAIRAVQMAIWETVVDPSATYTASSLAYSGTDRGRFYVASGTNDAALAGQYLVALSEYKAANPAGIQLSQLSFLIGDAEGKQDLLMGTNSSGVPEPGSLFLMGSALGMAGWWRRRRQKLATRVQPA